MSQVFAILSAVLVPLIVSAALSQVYGKTRKEELEDAFLEKTRFPSRIKVFALVFLIVSVGLFSVSAVLLAVYRTDFPAYGWLAFILASLFIILLSLLLLLLSLRSYEIIRGDGIVVQRLFSRKFFPYSHMASYHSSMNQLTVYGSDHQFLFGVYDNRVGMQSLLNQLESQNISKE